MVVAGLDAAAAGRTYEPDITPFVGIGPNIAPGVAAIAFCTTFRCMVVTTDLGAAFATAATGGTYDPDATIGIATGGAYDPEVG